MRGRGKALSPHLSFPCPLGDSCDPNTLCIEVKKNIKSKIQILWLQNLSESDFKSPNLGPITVTIETPQKIYPKFLIFFTLIFQGNKFKTSIYISQYIYIYLPQSCFVIFNYYYFSTLSTNMAKKQQSLLLKVEHQNMVSRLISPF